MSITKEINVVRSAQQTDTEQAGKLLYNISRGLAISLNRDEALEFLAFMIREATCETIESFMKCDKYYTLFVVSYNEYKSIITEPITYIDLNGNTRTFDMNDAQWYRSPDEPLEDGDVRQNFWWYVLTIMNKFDRQAFKLKHLSQGE